MLRYAILSLLAERDFSGYDLSKAFDLSITYIWSARQNQIYPELHKLEADGLVEGVDVPQEGRPDKRVYRITEHGRAALVEWVGSPGPPFLVRDTFQLRTLNLGRLPRGEARRIVEQRRAELQQRIDILAGIKDRLTAADRSPDAFDESFGWRLSVEAGLRTHAAYRDWCDWAIDQIDTATSPRRRRTHATGTRAGAARRP